VLCLELFGRWIAAIIPFERGDGPLALGPICLSSALLAESFSPSSRTGLGGGWLAQLAANFGIPNFTDAGARAGARWWRLTRFRWRGSGPRRGKFSTTAWRLAIPGHNIVLVLFRLPAGWWAGLGFDAQLRFCSTEQGRSSGGVVINAMLAASGRMPAAWPSLARATNQAGPSLSGEWMDRGAVAGARRARYLSVGGDRDRLMRGAVTTMIEIFELRLRWTIRRRDLRSCRFRHLGLIALDSSGHFFRRHARRTHSGAAVGISAAARLHAAVDSRETCCSRFSPIAWTTMDTWHGMDVRELGAGA